MAYTKAFTSNGVFLTAEGSPSGNYVNVYATPMPPQYTVGGATSSTSGSYIGTCTLPSGGHWGFVAIRDPDKGSPFGLVLGHSSGGIGVTETIPGSSVIMWRVE